MAQNSKVMLIPFRPRHQEKIFSIFFSIAVLFSFLPFHVLHYSPLLFFLLPLIFLLTLLSLLLSIFFSPPSFLTPQFCVWGPKGLNMWERKFWGKVCGPVIEQRFGERELTKNRENYIRTPAMVAHNKKEG